MLHSSESRSLAYYANLGLSMLFPFLSLLPLPSSGREGRLFCAVFPGIRFRHLAKIERVLKGTGL